VVSFLIIAAAMLALKASGSAIGWGFQLQNAGFVAFLAAVMVLVSANLLGLFELPVLFGEKATGIDDSTLGGSFFTGVLAVLVATPCTAPFMATAIGATLAFPTVQALGVFASLGLGMASPFLLISVWPAARRLLPKPGAWMKRFKHLLAVPMLATAAWLIWVLVQLLSPTAITLTDGHEPYSASQLAQLREEGKPVFVDATASWCLSCKVNERVALKPADMQQFFHEKNITIMVADWTNSDAAITAYLAEFKRNGVPLYVYYPPHQPPIVLPQILTPAIVRNAIANAPQ
jgi:thiol:disulfide interchange protein